MRKVGVGVNSIKGIFCEMKDRLFFLLFTAIMQVFMSAVLYLWESNASASVHCFPLTFVTQNEKKVTIYILSLIREAWYSRRKQTI